MYFHKVLISSSVHQIFSYLLARSRESKKLRKSEILIDQASQILSVWVPNRYDPMHILKVLGPESTAWIFSFVFLAPSPEETSFQRAGFSAVEEGTSQPVTISKK